MSLSVNNSIKPAELNTPEELLAGAKALLKSITPQMRRAVVLEAITALEVFIHNKIFKILNLKK